ncbi:hypothetical protein ACOMHN_003996 [Nucella lapillus]
MEMNNSSAADNFWQCTIEQPASGRYHFVESAYVGKIGGKVNVVLWGSSQYGMTPGGTRPSSNYRLKRGLAAQGPAGFAGGGGSFQETTIDLKTLYFSRDIETALHKRR